MSPTPWANLTDTLDELRDAIQQKTQGRLAELSVSSLEGRIAICARSDSYYGIQLALVVIKEFSTQFPQLAPNLMSFSIEGRRIVLGTSSRKRSEEPVPKRQHKDVLKPAGGSPGLRS